MAPVATLLLLTWMSLLLAAEADVVPAEDSAGVRLKDLVTIEGVRDNQLHGIGLVVGLQGTGDGSEATLRMVRQLLARKQLTVESSDLRGKSVAMVAVTADLPAFARPGTRLPAQVSCLGDAASLRGGILLQTPLVAADGRIYAVGQGSVSVGGYGDAGSGRAPTGTGHQHIETVAQLGEGAIVEHEVPASLLFGDRLRLVLRDPDFTTAHVVAAALAEVFGHERVRAHDAAVISLGFHEQPADADLVAAIARLGTIRVQPDVRARVVINARTGTVVVGREVRIMAAAVSHGGLSLRIEPQRRMVTDPNTGATAEQLVYLNQINGQRSLQPPAGTRPGEVPGTLAVLEGSSVEEIANGLNALGARPRDLVAIFEALRRAGALHAELVVM